MSAPPPTVIVVHPKENRKKCTVEPLRGRPDFVFCKYPKQPCVPLDNYVALGLDGPPLGEQDRDKGLLIVDGTWRLASKMMLDYATLPVRRLPGWVTAYPRVSKLTEDPLGGLATIEAIYLAYTLLGRDTTGLLDHYRWSADFLGRNATNV